MNRSKENAKRRVGSCNYSCEGDIEVWEAAQLQLDCDLANLVFVVLLMFGLVVTSSIQVNANKFGGRH